MKEEDFNYTEKFLLHKKWLNSFYPFFLLLDNKNNILDSGKLWDRQGAIGESLNDAFETISPMDSLEVSLTHTKTKVLFRGEAHKSENNILLFLTPELTSPDTLDLLGLNSEDISIRNSLLEKSMLYNENQRLKELIKEKDKELEDSRARCFHSSKLAALGEMASGIAHEINNPLAIISGSINVLKKTRKSGSVPNEILDECIDSTNSMIRRISKIIKGLRAISRDSSKLTLKKVNLKDIFDDVLGLCYEKFKYHEITLNLNYLSSEGDDFTVFADRVQISQVLINLLNNSFDALEKFNNSWVNIHIKNEGDFIRVKVIDSGKGIPKEIEEEMFEPFFTSKPIGKGTGLGLSISKKIVENNEGRFFYDSSHENTCFVLDLVKSIN